ncbi:hypothetical protein [Candidatus Similichlamydia laticola]|uniref:Uncharacterized protein n=1 Tax=Candidatus Similichlamydia laticola TaxID=2170265 RepID=A0A369KDJ0_9BACT|nr:hypothetical protein [Candidatus Similichlamydia laticola]RDB31672.1 hypothetical protein HAT2_00180 [Candidatus Similichlamydia laticola]
MVPVPELLEDPSLLRLGFVLLGSVVSRLCPRAQLLGGQFFGNSVCYEFVCPDPLAETQIGWFEEAFRQLCLHPPSFRLIRQPKVNAMLWAKSVGQSLLARVIERRSPEDLLYMVELEGRYDYTGGPLAEDPSPLRFVSLELEYGWASHLQERTCYRVRAVFPSCSGQRKSYLRCRRGFVRCESFFQYDAAKRRALPLEKGSFFLTYLMDWLATVFRKIGFYPTWIREVGRSSEFERLKLDYSFPLDHFVLWETQGRQRGWSVFSFHHYQSEVFPPSSAWGLFCLEFSHVFFASVFCTKEGLVLELRRVFHILQRLASSLGLNLSFCCVPSVDFSSFDLRDLWNRIGVFSEYLEGVGQERFAGYTWRGFDCLGRFWPLGRVRFAPLPKVSSGRTEESLWWVLFEPLHSLESLVSLLSFGGLKAVTSLPGMIRLFVSQKQSLPALVHCANKLEENSLSVQWNDQVRDLSWVDSSTDRECRYVCIEDVLGEICSVFDGREDGNGWKKEQFVDFVLRNQMSLLVEAMRRESI